MPLNCSQAISKLKAYKQQHQNLQNQFDEFLSQVPYLPDVKWDEPFMSSPHYKDITNAPKNIFDNLYDAKEEARKSLTELELMTYDGVLFFKQAENPYYEKITEDGMVLPNFDRKKLKNYKVDLNQVLYEDRKSYDEDFGLGAVLPQKFSELGLGIKQMKELKNRIALGEIPIFMPGRQAQLRDLPQFISQIFIPIVEFGKKHYLTKHHDGEISSHRFDNFVYLMTEVFHILLENKKQTRVNYDLLNDEQFEKIRNKLEIFGAISNPTPFLNSLIKAINSIPDRPYVFTVNTKEPIKFKKPEDLHQAIKNSNQERGVISIVEHLCLRKIFAERILALAKNQNKSFSNLEPIDYDNRVCFDILAGKHSLVVSDGIFEVIPTTNLFITRLVTRFYSNKK